MAVAMVDLRRPAADVQDWKNSDTANPRVSVGMPVYNGERFLRQAVDSLLNQTYGDFELIISDNGSTDATQELCETYAAADSRVRYVRHEKNRGAIFNWAFVVQAARGEYFKWASANDVSAPKLLEQCVQCLDTQPDVVIAYGRTEYIDDDGTSLGEYPHDVQVLDARPSVRFERLCRELRANNAQSSALIRLDVLRKTAPNRTFPGADMGLMAEIALYGGYQRLPDVLFYRRQGKASATKYRSAAELKTFLDPQSEGARQSVAWPMHLDYIASAWRAPIPNRERLAILRFVARSAWWYRKELWGEFMARLLPSAT
jgi:glycosyltransferase involved in cell wall biosynthesis